MKWKNIVLWIISILLTAMFVMAGSGKVFSPAQAGQMFVNYGYPAWFAMVTGLTEIIGGILLLVPRVAAYAAGALVVVMAGATVTHLKTAGEAPRALVPLVLLILSAVVGVARWRKN